MLFISDLAFLSILFSGLIIIGIGYFWKDRLAHLVRMVGLILFAIFWLIWTIEYMFILYNYYNVIFTVLAVFFLVFMAYHEYRDYTWNEETLSLKWLAGAICFGGLAYYIIAYNPYVAGALIYVVAWLTVTIMNGTGLLPTGDEIHLEAINYSDPLNVFVPLDPVNIQIILACTAIQAIILFAAIILFTPAPRKSKINVLMVTTLTIFWLNIVRNIATIWLTGTETLTFYQAHEVLGKTFSLIVLLILAFWVFTRLPEILDNIYGLIDLRFRTKPGMIEDGFVVLPEKHLAKLESKKPKNSPKKSTSGKNEKVKKGTDSRRVNKKEDSS